MPSLDTAWVPGLPLNYQRYLADLACNSTAVGRLLDAHDHEH